MKQIETILNIKKKLKIKIKMKKIEEDIVIYNINIIFL